MGADNGASEAFDLGSLTREDRPTPFRFTTPDGQTFTLPDPEGLKIGAVARLDGANPVAILEELLGRPVGDVSRVGSGDVASRAVAREVGGALRDRLGGITGLAALLKQSGPAVEADLRETYGVRLSDLPAGRLTWRELGVLVRGLPAGSRTHRALAGIDDYWTRTEQLLAGIYDMLRVLDWHYISAHTKTPPRRPEPLERPGVEKPRIGTTVLSIDEMRKRLPGVAKGEVVSDGS